MAARSLAAVLALIAGSVMLPATAAEPASRVEQGKVIAFDRSKGNCLACHAMAGGESPGTIGPPLVAMNVRYPDRDKLRSQIWDATVANPETAMPPFGRHRILSEDEIDAVVEFVSTL